MNRFAHLIVKNRVKILITTLILAAVMGFCAMYVKINYNMTDYLPKDANSTKAIKLMKENFNEGLTNCSLMMPDMEINEAIEMKEKLSKIKNVENVQWLDDVISITTPLETQDKETVEMYYKDKNALFNITIKEGKERQGVNEIYKLVGKDACLTGTAVSQASSQNLAMSQAIKSIIIIAPLIIFVLIISTTSWLEPLLYLLTIGIAVGITWGMQIIRGEMSYVTMAVSPILQLAVSLDYAVFLNHSFEKNLKDINNPIKAMEKSIKESFGAIAASAATTLFGFLALLFMEFRVGTDMGISLVMGVILSFLSVILVMPAFLLLTHKLMARCKHKRILPDFKKSGNYILKNRVPIMIMIIVLAVPAFLGQSKNSFIYGSGEPDKKSVIARAEAKTNAVFKAHTIVAILIPKENTVSEKLLVRDLQDMDCVTKVIAYANTVGNKIPTAFLGKDITKTFYSEKYARIIVYTNTKEEGKAAFKSIESIRKKAYKYYSKDSVYMCGQSANMYDMKNTVESDGKRVELITIIAIFLVLLIEFKSLSLPLIMILVIKIATWINMAIPYFTGEPLAYIGYLVVSTVMMGATIDYAILLTESYVKMRKSMHAKEAMEKTLGRVVKQALVSASILSVAGFALGLSSSEQIVKALGLLLGKGAVIAFILAMTVLPAFLLLFDKLIQKTTFKCNFI